MDFDKLLSYIVAIDDSIRFVLVTDRDGRIVSSRMSTDSFLLDEGKAALLGIDMQILRRLLGLYDDLIGENTFVHLMRARVHVLIYYKDQWTILVSCEREMDRNKLTDVSVKIESIVKGFMR